MQKQKSNRVNTSPIEEATGPKREGFNRNFVDGAFSVHFETVDGKVVSAEANSDEAQNYLPCKFSDFIGKTESEVAKLLEHAFCEISCPGANLAAEILIGLDRKTCPYSWLHHMLVEVVKDLNEGDFSAGRYATHCIMSAVNKGFLKIDHEDLCTLMVSSLESIKTQG